MLSPSSWSKYRASRESNRGSSSLQAAVRTAMDSAGIGGNISENHFPSPSRGTDRNSNMAFTPMKSSLPSTAEGMPVSPDKIGLGPLPEYANSRLAPVIGSPGKPRDASPSSVNSRGSTQSSINEIISRGKSRENLTMGGDPSKQNRMDKILSKNKADPSRKSYEIGMTLGVPNLKGLIGKAPIRSDISRHSDSKTNLIHLRVNTPADPPNASAISLIKVIM